MQRIRISEYILVSLMQSLVMEILIQVVGWIGTILVVLAYILVSTKKLDGASAYYQLLNLLGAACVGVNVYYQRAWPSFALNMVWCAIAIGTLVKGFAKKTG
jgi:hypothetical protein